MSTLPSHFMMYYNACSKTMMHNVSRGEGRASLMTTLTEADVVKGALASLSDLGWMVAHGPDIAPDTLAALRARPS